MDKSAARKEYKQARRPMGVYRIRNLQSGKSYIGFSTNLQARMNRLKFELKFGIHLNKELLGEWKSLGETFFEFEVLDELEHDENSKENPIDELRLLTDMWIGRLDNAGGSVVLL